MKKNETISPIEQHSIRVILLNSKNELLLMKACDPSTTELDGTYHGTFWFLVGGQVEGDESVAQTVAREIFEETGINSQQVSIGPIVWFGDFWLMLSGEKRHLKQKFIVAHTQSSNINTSGLTAAEKKVIKAVEWFSLERIRNCPEKIYPVGLADLLPPILAGEYPQEPQKIILDKKPIH